MMLTVSQINACVVALQPAACSKPRVQQGTETIDRATADRRSRLELGGGADTY